MKLGRIFKTEEEIFGISILREKISICLLKKKKKEIEVKKFAFEKLKPDVIERGILLNGEELKKAFLKLLNQFFKGKVPKFIPAIVSLPSYSCYFQLFDFPDRMIYEKLEESMKLQIGFSLPLSAELCYLDWEMVDEEEKKVLLSLVKKQDINPYLKVFEELPVFPIALETISLSLAHLLKPEETSAILFVSEEGGEVSFLKKGTVRFVNSIYFKDFGENLSISKKIKLISDFIFRSLVFYQADPVDQGEIKKIFLVGKKNLISLLKEKIKKLGKEIIIPSPPIKVPSSFLKEGNEILIILGAGLRGLIPREKDISISLLPVGTEEGYRKTQFISFLQFLRNWAIGIFLALFFLFWGSETLFSKLEKNLQNQLSSLKRRTEERGEMVKIEEKIKKFNSWLDFMNEREKEIYRWSHFLKILEKSTPLGIEIRELNALSYKEPIIIKGMAQKREDLLIFKEKLINSKFFKKVELPLGVLGKKENIPFTIKVVIK